ncbi:hypothetical protein SAMN05444320_105572, partial [Streptoalloteichus hindustanus]
DLPPIVVLETPRALSFMDTKPEVDYYATAIRGLRAVALNTNDSTDYITALL